MAALGLGPRRLDPNRLPPSKPSARTPPHPPSASAKSTVVVVGCGTVDDLIRASRNTPMRSESTPVRSAAYSATELDTSARWAFDDRHQPSQHQRTVTTAGGVVALPAAVFSPPSLSWQPHRHPHHHHGAGIAAAREEAAALAISLARQVEENERQAAALERALLLLAQERQRDRGQAAAATTSAAVRAAVALDAEALLETLAVTRCLVLDCEAEARMAIRSSAHADLEYRDRVAIERAWMTGVAGYSRRLQRDLARSASLHWVTHLADARIASCAPLTLLQSSVLYGDDARGGGGDDEAQYWFEEASLLVQALEASRRQTMEEREARVFTASIVMPLREAALSDSARVLIETLETQELTIAELRSNAERSAVAAPSSRDSSLPPLAPVTTPLRRDAADTTPQWGACAVEDEDDEGSAAAGMASMGREELLDLVAQLLEQNAALAESLVREKKSHSPDRRDGAPRHFSTERVPVVAETVVEGSGSPAPEPLDAPPISPARNVAQAYYRLEATARFPPSSPAVTPPRRSPTKDEAASGGGDAKRSPLGADVGGGDDMIEDAVVSGVVGLAFPHAEAAAAQSFFAPRPASARAAAALLEDEDDNDDAANIVTDAHRATADSTPPRMATAADTTFDASGVARDGDSDVRLDSHTEYFTTYVDDDDDADGDDDTPGAQKPYHHHQQRHQLLPMPQPFFGLGASPPRYAAAGQPMPSSSPPLPMPSPPLREQSSPLGSQEMSDGGSDTSGGILHRGVTQDTLRDRNNDDEDARGGAGFLRDTARDLFDGTP